MILDYNVLIESGIISASGIVFKELFRKMFYLHVSKSGP
jgi:hypothetical protein